MSRVRPVSVREPTPPGDSRETARTSPPSANDGLTYEHFSAGAALLASGNPAQAAVRLEKARAAEPDKASVREALGRAYFALGRWREAESEFRVALRVCPTNDYAHYCLSQVLHKSGREQEADAHLKLARAMGNDLTSPSGLC
jgi:tetratricopeptide (TPR) repeat protein